MRKQTKRITVRMTEKEYLLLQKKMHLANKKQTSFILDCIKNNKLIVLNEEKEIMQELKAIGNNINQIAKVANMTSTINNIRSLESEVNKIWVLLKRAKVVKV